LDKLGVTPDRSKLPPGWRWADWIGATEAERYWQDELPEKIRQIFRVRFEEITVVERNGRRLHLSKCYYKGPIGRAKVVYPSPGWRAMFFRDGNERCVSNFSNKGDNDYNKDMKDAHQARNEHFAKKAKRQ